MSTLRWTLLAATIAWTAMADEAAWHAAGTKVGTAEAGAVATVDKAAPTSLALAPRASIKTWVAGPATVNPAKPAPRSVAVAASAGVKPILRADAPVAKPASMAPMTLHAVYGRIDNWAGHADADGDGYYERFAFAVGIDADSYAGATAVYARIVCETTGQYWWSADAWTVSGTATDYRYFAFDDTDFAGRLTGHARLDFTVEIYNVSRTSHLATDATIDGEPLYADVAAPPAWYAVHGVVSDWHGQSDHDGDGYYERFSFRIGVDGDALPGPATVQAKLICTTTGQYWWSASAWTIAGTDTDYRWFSFDHDDFAGRLTGNTTLDFTVELWNSDRTARLAADAELTDEWKLRADVAPPAWFTVYSQVSDWTGLTDGDHDGYFERYRFRIGVDGDALPYSAIVHARLVCLTTNQYWWSADPWVIAGTATDYRWFNFDDSDFAGRFTGNRQLDFRVELWNETRSAQLAATGTVVGEEHLRVDDYVAPTRATLTLGAVGSGQVEVNGVLRTLPYSGSAPIGTAIVLRAIPSVGWRFDGWNGDLAAVAESVSFILSADRAATAVFSERPDAPPATRNLVYTLAARGQQVAASTVPLTAAGYLVLDPDARLATVLLRWSDGRRERFDWHQSGLWYVADGGGRRFQVLTAGSAAPLGGFTYGHLLGAEHASTVAIGGGQRQRLSAAFSGPLRGGTPISYSAVELTARIDLAATRRYNDERIAHADLTTLLGSRLGIAATTIAAPPPAPAAVAAGVAIYSLRLNGVEAGHGAVAKLNHSGYLVVDLATGHIAALLAWRDGSGAWYRREDWSTGTPIATNLPLGERTLALLGNRECVANAEALRLLHGPTRELAIGGNLHLPVATTLGGNLWQHDASGNRYVQADLRATLLAETLTANDQAMSAAEAVAWLESRLPLAYRPK